MLWHSLATLVSLAIAVRMAFVGPLWAAALWYFASFMGVHVVMVPLMTAWNSMMTNVERRVRAVVEEELIRFDMQTYESQLQRVIASPPTRPKE